MTGIPVVYVLGRGRSGSTVFAQAVGALDGFCFAGEVRFLWDPVLTHDSPCACGEPIRDCPVWSKVLARLRHVDPAQVARWQQEVVREARLPRLLRRRSAERWPALVRYRAVMNQVYQAIAEVTGCWAIVDSSKRPSYALVVRDLPAVSPVYVHLVRDPRASAYSWRTRRHRGAAGTTVRQRGAVDATLRWDLLNLGAEAVLRSAPADRRLRLRYEDFAAAPRPAVDRVAALVGGPPASSAFVDERTVLAPVSHAIAGNPARQRTGRVVIREDGEWWSAQPARDRWLAAVTAGPLLRRYRYPLRPSSSA
ncbi:MAG TPA: sulfotransferase [Natronosporangium sp.]